MMYVDPTPTRVDYLKFETMKQIHELVDCVRKFVEKNPLGDTEDYINQVAEKVGDVFEGKISSDAHSAIKANLRKVAMLVNANDKDANDRNVNFVAKKILNIVQGDNKMSSEAKKNKVRQTVLEAMELAQANAAKKPGQNWGEVANDYATEIIEDVLGSRENEDQVLVGEVGSRDWKVLFQGAPFEVVTWLRDVPDTVFAVRCADHPDLINSDDYLRKYENVGKPIPSRQISEFVDKYYEMDPETEDVLDNGTLVVDGMKVLIESPDSRAEIYDGMDSSEISQARKQNRWATVEHAKVENQKYNGPMLSFIAVYDDGVKRQRTRTVNHAWIVKKDSIPRIDSIYSVPQGVFVFRGAASKVVEILQDFDLNQKTQDLHQVQVGVGGNLVSISDYLYQEGVTGEIIPNYGVDQEPTYDVVGVKGAILFSGTAAQVVNWMRDKSSLLLEVCKVVQIGVGETTPAQKFLAIHENVNVDPTYDVVGPDGSTVFGGTETRVVMWLNAQPREFRAGSVVGRTDSEDLISAGAFIDLAGREEKDTGDGA